MKRPITKTEVSVPVEIIHNKIYLIRGQKVMLDRDLAQLYGVLTFRLNEQVRRNYRRFPEDFMFQLNDDEKNELIANCDQFKSLKHSSSNPYAFTEQGVAMLSSVLNSQRAIDVNIQIIRVFVRLKELMLSHKDLAQRIDQIEKKYDYQFKVFDAIKQILQIKEEENKNRGPLGFQIPKTSSQQARRGQNK